ncbi:MAG TPA: DUF4411 family protein [Xanthobacteraceae bacterium]|nr:DUF4411 family protein [Xanthobacteraceae bacterium]
MIYLLDADTLIRADTTFYPLRRFPVFWQWLRFNGSAGAIKIPFEQYEEVTAGKGQLVEWLKDEENREALLFTEEVDPNLVAKVTVEGYAPDLDEAEQETVGRDPFLIAYAVVAAAERCVVSFEVSAPSKKRANRKVPDICADFGVKCITLFDLINLLDFTTDWHP